MNSLFMIHYSIILKTLKNIFLLITLFLGIYLSQLYFDSARAREPKPSPYIPASEVIKTADLGLHSAASSYYWLAAIQYLGDWQDDKHAKMSDFLELSTQLDPKFSHPYAFGTLILPSYDQFDQAVGLGTRGIQEAEPNWQIPYYLGTAYHMYKSDTMNAAKYFDIAAHTKGAPDNIVWIAANYGSRPDIREQTILIWQSIYETTNDSELKDRAKIYIYHFELMNFLEEAAKEYKNQHGTFPNPIEKLVEEMILKEIPRDPFGYQFEIDENGRAITKYQSE